MKKLVYIVCGLNASRSQVVEEFLKGKYADNRKIEIKSAGLNVDIFSRRDKRTLFTEELAERADIIFVSDYDKLCKINYYLFRNDEKKTKKVHLLGIPDIFPIHKNAHIGNFYEYVNYLEGFNKNPEFSALREYVSHLTPESASALMEALYLKELYSAHRSQEPIKRNKKYPDANWNETLHKTYPFQLLQKTLEFRFPSISKIIEK
jgi:protein-tyrosine-phosphatase